MFNEINAYGVWNHALLRFFFPNEREDAILYLDETVLSQVADLFKIKKADGQTWCDAFLRTTLVSDEALSRFTGEWGQRTGDRSSSIPVARSWDKLVNSLMGQKLDGDPAYFAMLCAIMLLASIADANHSNIREAAQKYLGSGYTYMPGKLINSLLQQLHKDYAAFNPDRMICGNQRNMSRLKFHLVLSKRTREDFIDFLEINNLQWQYEPFAEFVNNTLVPALDKAGKRDLIRIITAEENIPYIKNILSGNLHFGKKESTFGNTIQEKNINWRYELVFNFDGSYSFSILCDHQPFSLSLKDGCFEFTSDPYISDYIADNVPVCFLPAQPLLYNGQSYNVRNISEGSADYGKRLYFERVSDDVYRQVETPINGKEYYVFVSSGERLREYERLWQIAPDITESRFTVLSVQSISFPRNAHPSRVKVEDTFQFRGLGSWFSIYLSDKQSLFWKPNTIGASYEQLNKLLKGKDGKYYFRIRPTSNNHLSGNILVKEDERDVLSEQIACSFEWDGNSAYYHMNGWGEISNTPLNEQQINDIQSAKQILQYSLPDKTEGSDILLQVLYDLADKSGCVSEDKMIAAVSFVFSFFGIEPNEKHRKSLINALRRLGYFIAYYDIDRRTYSNQLISRYAERSNYSISATSVNALVVKGAYSLSDIDGISSKNIYRKRPYAEDAKEAHPEYCCLPDIILFEGDPNNQWQVLKYPMADYLISSMNNMSGFAQKYGINNDGEIIFNAPTETTPCMIKTNKRNEVLCTSSHDGVFFIHRYYDIEGTLRPIPKHLARVYCQNARNLPVCMMEFHNRKVNYAKISFISGMGLPEVLDVALCDLSLGIPASKDVFIMDKDRILWSQDQFPITEIRDYSTTATSLNHQYLKDALSKLSGRNIEDFNESNIICRYKVLPHYYLKITKKYAEHTDLISLYLYNDLLAFALGDRVFYKDRVSNDYYKVEGDSVNEMLSSVIRNKIRINEHDRYKKPIPTHPSNPKETKKILIFEILQ